MLCMTCFPSTPAATWHALRDCAGWEYHVFADGPLSRLLLHVVADPLAMLRHGEHGAARASVRLMLRGGNAFGASLTAPRASLRAVLLEVGAALAGQPYNASAFSALDTVVNAALLAAGHRLARINLEHSAPWLPRPVLMADQMGRLALGAVRHAHGDAALDACPPALAAHWLQACALDDPAVRAWRSARDPHAVRHCATARAAHGVVPDSLVVHNFIASSTGNARNRAQAMTALPWLLPMLIAHASGRSVQEAPAILVAIDAGSPLFEAVAHAFDVPREVVRWLSRRTLPANWLVDVRRLRRLLTLLSWLAPERRPQNAAQFADLKTVAGALTAPLDFIDGVGQLATLDRMAPCMRHWLAHAWPADVSALLDAKDFLRALFEARQSVDGFDAAAADAAVLAWCASIRVTRLLTLSRAWHAAIAAETWGAGNADAGAHWPPVLMHPWHHDDRTIVELTSAEQLRSEGHAMQHCVGGYAAACRSGNSVIVALRSAAGAALSTAELHLHATAPRITVAQHRAVSNTAPGLACVRALGALLVHLDGAGQVALLRQRRDFQAGQSARRREGESRFNRYAQDVARRLAA